MIEQGPAKTPFPELADTVLFAKSTTKIIKVCPGLVAFGASGAPKYYGSNLAIFLDSFQWDAALSAWVARKPARKKRKKKEIEHQ